MKTIRPHVLAFVVLIAVSLVTGSAIAAATHDSPVVKQIDATGKIAPHVYETFGVMRRQPVQPNGLVPDQVGMLTHSLGLSVELAQPISDPKTKADLWVAPTSEGICILMLSPGAYGPGGGCSSADDSLRGQRMTYAAYANDDFDVAGLTMDGVESVRLTLKNGDTEVLPVNSNVWNANVSSEPVQVQFELPDGTTVTDGTE
jgi:hypothetical protein